MTRPSDMRLIVIDDVTYLWRRTHKHDQGCVEKLVVIVEKSQEHGGARLALSFREAEGWVPGDFDSGVLEHPEAEPVNLNRPAVVRALVERARQSGWPTKTKTIELENPYDWLTEVPRGRT